MSTKRLSRTVIEGGRHHWSKFSRRNSHKEARAEERAFMSKVKLDPENYEEEMAPELRPAIKDFDDKLGPMYAWLEAQVGKKWADIRSEIAEKFDIRTTAGRHITFDHLLYNINDTLSGFDKWGYIAKNKDNIYHGRNSDYYVNEDDILCKIPPREKYKYYYTVSKEELEAIGKWLNGRMIGEKGGVLYWVLPSDNLAIWESKWTSESYHMKYGWRDTPNALHYFTPVKEEYEEKVNWSIGPELIKRTGNRLKWIEEPAGFKQAGALTQVEIKTFKSFTKGAREEILSYGNKRIC